ncbi:MAG TPA: dihydrodipicolinate synthase family protein, partial [Acidimicrobiales bacterium]|nr:dihydrodipicolinate synthase family protein [Acidimicrobiales bacterium]
MDVADPPFTGVGVALVTLFDPTGELDAEATARHAGHLVDRGVRAVLVAGSTGEAAALDPDE